MIPQSATSITTYKTCPMKYRLKHVLRLQPIKEADVLRWGTNWHRCLEILRADDCADPGKALVRHMNEVYADKPPNVDAVDWEVERTVLLYSALGWAWYWKDDQLDVVAQEVKFEREINSVYTRRGKIDKIIRVDDRPLILEHKSTSKPIDSGSAYWNLLNMDSQITLYLIEARHLQLTGQLEQYGIKPADLLISGMLYDVWHKPTIRPKKLSQADSKKFVEIGEYCGEKFKIEIRPEPADGAVGDDIFVNDVLARVTPGKKEGAFTIRETPEMFGARLLADIRGNPEKHFARKEVTRTDKELERFDKEYYNLARTAAFMERQNLWFANEHSCNATYRCEYHGICWYGLDVENGSIPDGFERV